MTQSTPLQILVTRPLPAGAVLCEKINAAGYQAIAFPTLVFLPAPDTKTFNQTLKELAQNDWLIFISPQAVTAASAAIHKQLPSWPTQLNIAAVGEGTAQALQAANFPPALYPPSRWDSEGLLALPEFSNLTGKRCVLVRGAKGRELLADELTARGAQVSHLIAYERGLPRVDSKKIVRQLQNHNLALSICTSSEGMQNLLTLVAAAQTELLALPLVVISERMRAQAREMGFKTILLAQNASHDAIISVLNQEFAHKSQQGLIMENQTDYKPATAAAPLNSPRSAWGSVGIIISAASFIVLIAAFYFAYHALLVNADKLSVANSILTDKTMDNAQQISQLRQAVEAARQNTTQLQTALTDQQQALSQIHNTQQVKDALNMGEAQYLAALAQDNLQIGDNVPLVINLLQNADQKIRDLSDPNLLAIRKALATDIAALQAVPTVDTTGIYLQLVALNTQVDKLPLPTLRPAEGTQDNSEPTKRIVWWKRGLQQSWDSIRKMVVIRYNKAGQIPFITPDQQQYLYQNLHAMFEQAMAAVVHKQPEIYQASLAQAANWVKQYFLGDAAVTQAMLNNLTQLQNQNIKPALPPITATLQALRDYAAASQDASKATPSTATKGD